MECPEKAAEYDRQHQEAAEAPRWGPKHSGAVELAGQYTKGSCGHLQCGLFVSKLVLEIGFCAHRKAAAGNNVRFYICCF